MAIGNLGKMGFFRGSDSEWDWLVRNSGLSPEEKAQYENIRNALAKLL
jgi:hypothetical protein